MTMILSSQMVGNIRVNLRAFWGAIDFSEVRDCIRRNVRILLLTTQGGF